MVGECGRKTDSETEVGFLFSADVVIRAGIIGFNLLKEKKKKPKPARYETRQRPTADIRCFFFFFLKACKL